MVPKRQSTPLCTDSPTQPSSRSHDSASTTFAPLAAAAFAAATPAGPAPTTSTSQKAYSLGDGAARWSARIRPSPARLRSIRSQNGNSARGVCSAL